MRALLIVAFTMTCIGCYSRPTKSTIPSPVTQPDGWHTLEVRDEKGRILSRYAVEANSTVNIPAHAKVMLPHDVAPPTTMKGDKKQ